MKNITEVLEQLEHLYHLLERVTQEDGYLPINDIMVLERRKNDVSRMARQLQDMRY